MLNVYFKASFIRKMNALPKALQEDALDKIGQLKSIKNHQLLKVHKLHGPLAGLFSFSVNYKTRIVFERISKNEVALLSVGDHDIYN